MNFPNCATDWGNSHFRRNTNNIVFSFKINIFALIKVDSNEMKKKLRKLIIEQRKYLHRTSVGKRSMKRKSERTSGKEKEISVVDSCLLIASMRPTYFTLLRQDWIQEKRNTYTFLCRPHLRYTCVPLTRTLCNSFGFFLSSRDGDERYTEKSNKEKKHCVTSEIIWLIFFLILAFALSLLLTTVPLFGAWVGVRKNCLLN